MKFKLKKFNSDRPESFRFKLNCSLNRFLSFIKLVYKRFLNDDVPALGAQVTYYLVLSFFPFLIFLLAVLSYTPFTGSDILGGFSRLLPNAAYNLLEEIINQASGAKSKTLLSFSMLATIWAASNGISAFIRGINKAYDQKESRSFWRIKAMSIIFTLAIAIVLVFSFFMLVLGEMLWRFAFNYFELSGAFRNGWNIIRHLIPLFTMFIVFVAAYMYIPNRSMTFKETIPGALFSTFGLILISLIFSYCVNNFGLYTNTYGSIAGIIILLIWLYWSSIIIILGGEINATIRYNRKDSIKNRNEEQTNQFKGGKNEQLS